MRSARVPLRSHPTRAHLVSRLLTALPIALLSGVACHVGEAPPGAGGGGGSPDANSAPAADSGGGASDEDAGGGGGGGGDGVVDSVPTDCVDFETAAIPDGAFHPVQYDYDEASGQGCLGMCHKEGADEGMVYSVAGAVYGALAEGSEHVAGARIFVTDSGGKSVRMTTATNGMFYTQEALTPPLTTFVTGCGSDPDRLPMAAPAGSGNCGGSAACHGTNFRVYIEPP